MAAPTIEAVNPFRAYKQTLEPGLISFSAGFPNYPRNFSRDALYAGIIASSAELLVSQLGVSAHYQGVKHDALTGERPGRIHHEIPGVSVHGREQLSTYNACDTTPLFLIAAEGLGHIDEDAAKGFMGAKRGNIERAVDDVLNCVGEDMIFWEKPPEGGDGYALKLTYWKDSVLPHASGKEEPSYPVVFAQAHFIAARCLLSASRILNDSSLATRADLMYRTGISKFVKPAGYTVYRDSVDELVQTSSDELHSLAYIPRKYSDLLPIEAIRQRAQEITTPFGFMCTPGRVADQLADQYHGKAVWVFEQAMIHYGTTKFGLEQEAQTAASVARHIGEGQELLGVAIDEQTGTMTPSPKGNDRQLWSSAANEYFAGRSTLLDSQWL